MYGGLSLPTTHKGQKTLFKIENVQTEKIPKKLKFMSSGNRRLKCALEPHAIIYHIRLRFIIA